MAEIRHKVLLGPENSAGRYFYAEQVKFGSVRVARRGEIPLSIVEVEECRIGVKSTLNPPAVAVETDDTLEAIKRGTQQIHDSFGSAINRNV